MNWLIEQVGLQSDIAIASLVFVVIIFGMVCAVVTAGVITFLWGFIERNKRIEK